MRAAYRDIQPYDPRRAPCRIDLSDNTNLFGMPPAAMRVLTGAANATITRYPSVYASQLKQGLADLHGVEPINVTTGCGSDDVIDSAVRALCEPGDTLAYADPTFGIISTFAMMNAVRPLPVANAAELASTGARITYICTPNNPTGAPVARSVIQSINGIVLLDEAYAAFGDVDYGTMAAKSTSIVSLRTMSKAWGLAGLRVGYAIGSAELICEIEKSRGPYKISGLAEAAAIAAITSDREWVAEVIAQTKENRARLINALTELRIHHFDSAGNFVLIQLPEGWTAERMSVALRAQGVAVRPFGGVRGAGECIRVTVGPWPMLERFLNVLVDTLEACAL